MSDDFDLSNPFAQGNPRKGNKPVDPSENDELKMNILSNSWHDLEIFACRYVSTDMGTAGPEDLGVPTYIQSHRPMDTTKIHVVASVYDNMNDCDVANYLGVFDSMYDAMNTLTDIVWTIYGIVWTSEGWHVKYYAWLPDDYFIDGKRVTAEEFAPDPLE